MLSNQALSEIQRLKRSYPSSYANSIEAIFDSLEEAIYEGWGVHSHITITPLMLAEALLREARTQDKCVRDGDSEPGYPAQLRQFALSFMLNAMEEALNWDIICDLVRQNERIRDLASRLPNT